MLLRQNEEETVQCRIPAIPVLQYSRQQEIHNDYRQKDHLRCALVVLKS
jgi:hypothetical protein